MPDIPLNSSPANAGYLYCTSDTSAWSQGQQGSCTSGFRDSSTNDLTVAGGTSFAAPRLLTAEIVIFEFLYWIPKLSGGSHNRFMWAGNAISIAIGCAAWVVSDAICEAAKRAPIHVESTN